MQRDKFAIRVSTSFIEFENARFREYSFHIDNLGVFRYIEITSKDCR